MAAGCAVRALPSVAARIPSGDLNSAMTRSRFAHFPLALLLVILMIALPASAEWKEQVLYSFQGGTTDGSGPAGGVVFDRQGNLYGATTAGGPESCTPIGYECGMAFELTPPAQKGGPWTETLIYQFQGEGSKDASVPTSGLIFDAAGNLYGVTAHGGTGTCVLVGIKAGCGTVYELSPPTQQGGAWTETILYSFQGGNDGYFPWGNLVLDKHGNLYGATQFGGGKGTTCDIIYGGQCGTVFKLSPPKQKGGAWTEKVLRSFAGGTDGANPNGGLVINTEQAIYGTTYSGGNQGCKSDSSIGCGTAFRLTEPTKKRGEWTQKRIHVFQGRDDGGGPNGSLVCDARGDVYGTAGGGGVGQNGVAFRIAHSTGGHWTETVLRSFAGGDDGSGPSSGLVFDNSGNLYGTALGGKNHLGVVYRLAPPLHGTSWSVTILYNFTGSPDGNHPLAGVVLEGAGKLYGTTIWGGTGSACQGGCGVVFEASR
jgi:hypothetical protein